MPRVFARNLQLTETHSLSDNFAGAVEFPILERQFREDRNTS